MAISLCIFYKASHAFEHWVMSLLDHYSEHVASGALKPDLAQMHVLTVLHDLATRLEAQKPKGLVSSIFGRHKLAAQRGLYIHGEVGRGKTMLMDLFYKDVERPKKRRVHFHGFMQEVHQLRGQTRADDVISTIADQLAQDATLLCLDEMQIADIADAMILGRLYEALLQRGVTLVTTSNVPPENLYKDGLNRDLFLPFIAKLRDTLDVVSLDSPRDYRLGRLKLVETFLTPLQSETAAAFETLWSNLTDQSEGRSTTLDVVGRKLAVPRAAHGCAMFSFADLCEQPLGPPDYLALAATFRTIFIRGIPILGKHQRNEAKRFILMIDSFYDAGTRLVATAAAPPDVLMPKSQHGFEFQRTVSRLKEMQSASWWGKGLE
jgi:cell division protein ZapE